MGEKCETNGQKSFDFPSKCAISPHIGHTETLWEWQKEFTKTIQWLNSCRLVLTAVCGVLPFKYDNHLSQGLYRIDLHWWFPCFPCAWHHVTFGRFRHTQRQRAHRWKWDIDSRWMCRASHGSSPLWGSCYYARPRPFVAKRNADHRRRWPSQGLQNEGINSNSLTSQLADRDEYSLLAAARYVGFLRLSLQPRQGPFKLTSR